MGQHGYDSKDESVLEFWLFERFSEVWLYDSSEVVSDIFDGMPQPRSDFPLIIHTSGAREGSIGRIYFVVRSKG